MRIVIRHIVLASIPLVIGVATGWVFAHGQPGCGSLVGPLFAAKCGRTLVQYQLQFQTAGTAAGCLVAALVGIWLEARRTVRAARAAQATPPPPPPA
ncbi:MAG TPA: hypothetical protein VIV10_08920 [Gemmatimonadales bacterium]